MLIIITSYNIIMPGKNIFRFVRKLVFRRIIQYISKVYFSKLRLLHALFLQKKHLKRLFCKSAKLTLYETPATIKKSSKFLHHPQVKSIFAVFGNFEDDVLG